MKRNPGLLLLAFAVAALAGCSKHSTAPVGGGESAEQQGVQSSLASMPEVMNDGLADDQGPMGFSMHGAGGPLATPGPEYDPEPEGGSTPPERRFHRVINDVSRSFTFEFSDNDDQGRPRAAHVVVNKLLTGWFIVVHPETLQDVNGQDSVVARYVQKPLRDRWVRPLWLVRCPRLEGGEDPRRGWRLKAASGVNVTSEIEDEGKQPHIQSVQLQVGENVATFTDPAAAIHWYELWHAPAGSQVSVTVTTDQQDDVVVLYSFGGRVRLTSNGDGTYSGGWTTPSQEGLKHFGVDAFSHATLYDDEAGYHSNAWLFPYLNDGEAGADDSSDE